MASSRARRSAPAEARSAADAPVARSSDAAPRDQRLLSEMSHELGNYFHKLYYWAELLREQRPTGGDAEPAELLERTIRDLETFLKTALEFFRPLSITPLAMSVADVATSSRVLLARHAEPAPLAWEGPPASEAGVVAVDPGRFSFVLEGLVRRLHAADCPPASVKAHFPESGRL